MSPFAITWSPIVFGFALFLSSALLFLIQPIVGRTLLPHLGGNPLAWQTCLVFFQSTFLAGCLFADLLHRFRGLRWQPWLHLFLMALAIVSCFAGLFGDRMLILLAPRLDSFDTWPIVSAICLLIVAIGLPCFVLAATVPLLQRWFSHLDHPRASDPYFLFVASNLGGMIGLIVYVLLIEPNVPVSAQWLSWKLAFSALWVMVFLAALCAWRSPRNPEIEPPEKPSDPNAPPLVQLVGRGPATWPRRLYWLVAAGLPIALLMGLTDYLTLDLPPTPILWTVPIAIYLFALSQAFARFSIYDKGSFVTKLIVQIVFGICVCIAVSLLFVSLLNMGHPGDPHHATMTVMCVIVFGLFLLVPSTWLTVLQPLNVLVVVFLQVNVFKLNSVFLPTILLYLASYYFTIRLCLNLLANDRPVASALTTYYSWIGVGGVVGGLFQLVVAPHLFRTGYVDYVFAAALACTLRPAWLARGLIDWLVTIPFAKTTNPNERSSRMMLALDLLIPIVAIAAAGLLLFLRRSIDAVAPRPDEHFLSSATRQLLLDIPLVVAMLLALVLIARPFRFGLCLAGIVILYGIAPTAPPNDSILVLQRTPLGIHRVTERKLALLHADREPPLDLTERRLTQGNAIRGSSIVEPAEMMRHPVGAYHRKGPVGQVMRNLEWFSLREAKGQGQDFWLKKSRDNAKDDVRIAASIVGMGAAGITEPITAAWSEPPYAFVGLNAGSLFAYAHPFQWVDAFEHDPAIIALSDGDEPTFPCFRAAQNRGANAKIHLGDGRRLLTKAGREGFYQVLFIDAFHSDAMPMHLLTKQAIETYFFKLAPDGVVCVHTTNRNVDLHLVLDQVARRLDIAAATLQIDVRDNPTMTSSEWVVLARNTEVLRKWEAVGEFSRKQMNQGFGPFRNRDFAGLMWTDDRASLFAATRDGQTFPNFVKGMLGFLLASGLVLAILEMFANHMGAAKTKADISAKGKASNSKR